MPTRRSYANSDHLKRGRKRDGCDFHRIIFSPCAVGRRRGGWIAGPVAAWLLPATEGRRRGGLSLRMFAAPPVPFRFAGFESAAPINRTCPVSCLAADRAGGAVLVIRKCVRLRYPAYDSGLSQRFPWRRAASRYASGRGREACGPPEAGPGKPPRRSARPAEAGPAPALLRHRR